MRLANGPVEYPGKGHIVELLDQFEMTGPNGRHQCLVTEALGPWLKPKLLSPREIWEVARQLVEATVYMHSMNIVHGSEYLLESFMHLAVLRALTNGIRADICDENVLLTSSDLLRGDECPPIKRYGICEVETIDGSVLTAQAPRYQVEAANSKYIEGTPCVKIVGFGKRYAHGIHYGEPIPAKYKAPEVIFNSHFSPSADIWSLGCIVLNGPNLRSGSSTDFFERYSKPSREPVFTDLT